MRESQNPTPTDTAILTFFDALANITPVNHSTFYEVNSVGDITQYQMVFGLLTSAQAASALTLLNTLNAALGITVMCVQFPVTKMP